MLNEREMGTLQSCCLISLPTCNTSGGGDDEEEEGEVEEEAQEEEEEGELPCPILHTPAFRGMGK